MAVVVFTAGLGVDEPCWIGFGMDEVWVGGCEVFGFGPEGGKGAGVVEDVHIEAVFEVVVLHETEDVVIDVTEVVDLLSSVEGLEDSGHLRQVQLSNTSQSS